MCSKPCSLSPQILDDEGCSILHYALSEMQEIKPDTKSNGELNTRLATAP